MCRIAGNLRIDVSAHPYFPCLHVNTEESLIFTLEEVLQKLRCFRDIKHCFVAFKKITVFMWKRLWSQFGD